MIFIVDTESQVRKNQLKKKNKIIHKSAISYLSEYSRGTLKLSALLSQISIVNIQYLRQ